jgi:hypothetical protein
MLSDAQTETLVGLGHEVSNVDADSAGWRRELPRPR